MEAYRLRTRSTLSTVYYIRYGKSDWIRMRVYEDSNRSDIRFLCKMTAPIRKALSPYAMNTEEWDMLCRLANVYIEELEKQVAYVRKFTYSLPSKKSTPRLLHSPLRNGTRGAAWE